MSIKRIIAAAAASVVAVSAMSVAAFAGIANATDSNGNYLVDLIAEGYNVADVYGVTFTISGDFAETGVGGGIGFNSASTGWDQHEWGNADAAKEISLTEDNKVTYLVDHPAFAESDTTGENPYAQVWISQWWGNDATVESVEVLGADGVVLEATAPADPEPDPAPADPEPDPAPADPEPDPAPADPEPSPAPTSVDTGVEGVAAILGVAAVAAGAMIVSKKRK
ncbi:MAG: NPXTG-anchored protein [Oscillospiraceae bacterium]|nr:NPXTG-anchored protein [Oscillospiraceae bacterium]